MAAQLNTPTVAKLLEFLRNLVDWELVAVQLRGMNNDEINKINRESSGSTTEQKKRLCFSKWLDMCPDPSWDDVVTALEKGNEFAIVEEIRNKLKTSQNETIPSLEAEKKQEVLFPKDKEGEIVTELSELYDSFTQLLLNVQDEIEDLVNSNKIPLSKLARKIRAADAKRLKNIVNECNTVNDLNDRIFNICSFLDGSILHGIVKYGLSHHNDLKSGTEEHKKQAKEFRDNAKLKDLKDQISEIINAGNSQAQLVAKVNNDWDRATINNVTMLIEYLADNKDINPKLVKVISSSVEVTLLISEDDETCFDITTEQKKQFIRLVGMFYLRVGENPPIFQEDESMNYTFENGLLEAAKTGHVQAIEFILSIGIDVDHTNNDGKTALLLASEHGHSEAVKLILSAGASVDIQDNIGLTAVMVAKTVDIYQTLVQANANTNIVTHKGLTPLMISCLRGNHDVANYQLFTLKHNITTRPDGRWTLLMAASIGGNNKIVEYLLNNGHDPNAQDNNGTTAIQLSCLQGHYTVTEILLKHNADPSIPDNDGWTPLMVASQEGHHKIVQLLPQKGVDPNKSNSINGQTALMQASQNGHNETVQLLLSNGAHPNIQKINGDTAIHRSCLKGHYTVTEILLKHNADPSIPHNDGWTPLMSASREGHHKIVELLLQKGVNPNTANSKNGQTALILASQNGHNETVQLLLSNGAHPNIQKINGDTAINISCLNGHYTVTEILLKHNADPSIPDNDGWTPLMSASQEGHHKIVQLLLQKGDDPNTLNNKNGQTALMQASRKGHDETVELLLSNGADSNIQNSNGTTALQLSCLNGHTKVTEILLKHNADPSIPDISGQTPLMSARHPEMFNLLLNSQQKTGTEMITPYQLHMLHNMDEDSLLDHFSNNY